MKTLNPQQAKFVAEYLRHSNGTAAAKSAGYTSPTQASVTLLKNPAVKEALDKPRKALEAEGLYNLKAAMKECEDAMAFAKETENANAYTKAVELRAKLNGLMVEKHDMRTVGFHVSVDGIDFSKRNSSVEIEAGEVIELEKTEDTGEDLLNE